MTHRVTLDIPTTGLNYGIPYVTSDDANATIFGMDNSSSAQSWSGVQIDHAPEPGTTGTATVSVLKQSDNSLVATNYTSGTLYLYYPNNTEYSNANLLSNQGICDWDTYYYINIVPNTPSQRRENIAIRKLLTTTSSP